MKPITRAEWQKAVDEYEKGFREYLNTLSTDQERLDVINNQRGPWDDTGRLLWIGDRQVVCTGNFSDGGVKYELDGQPMWRPRFETSFVE